MASIEDVLDKLMASAKPDQLEGMSRFGMVTEQRLGVSVPDMRKIAKLTGKDHPLALQLWDTGIAEARIVASMIANLRQLTDQQMEDWVKGFNSWDVCDQVCMNLFEKTPLAWSKTRTWANQEPEFVKRAAFALIACLAWHDKSATDEQFIELLPLMQQGATAPRNFVKKAVSWAMRNTGKRNPTLRQATIEAAQEIQRINSKTARWIASDVLRELQSDAVTRRLQQTESKGT